MDGSQQWNGSFLELGYLSGRAEQGELLGLGHASRLRWQVPLAGVLKGSLGEPEPWNMALDIENTLQEARPSLPCKPIAAMEVFYASQLAYRIPMAPAGAGNNISYFF